jgi:hypothetical protein
VTLQKLVAALAGEIARRVEIATTNALEKTIGAFLKLRLIDFYFLSKSRERN